MSRRHLVFVLLLLCPAVIGIVVADPLPRHGTDESPLNESEAATLWSGDPDECIDDETYQTQYGESRNAMQKLANCTDITFKQPPETAVRWSRHDFGDLDPGGVDESIHPPHADRTDSWAIKDAHATMFAVHPSTRLHHSPNETVHYIAPEGTVRGFVDYRVQTPDDQTNGTRTVQWTLENHQVSEVRLYRGDLLLATDAETQTPVLEYSTNGTGTGRIQWTIEAEIEATFTRNTTITSGNRTRHYESTVYDEVTVSHSVPWEVYDLTAYSYYGEFPNGDQGWAVHQAEPWHGYSLTADGDERVRGVWRYYTARNRNWDTLVRSSERGSTEIDSPAHPVYVHAYPSRIGPRAEPVWGGPELIEVWGDEVESPEGRLNENVEVEVVDSPYTRSDGLSLRTDDIDPEQIRIHGVVRGVSARIIEPNGDRVRSIRESDLDLELVDEQGGIATLRVKLTDAETGDPIVLNGDDGRDRSVGASRVGVVTVAGHPVTTNESGVAVVRAPAQRVYTAEYHPRSWLDRNPAYTGATASVATHPLAHPAGWLSLAVELLWHLAPFLVALYAGLRLGAFLRLDEHH